MTMPGGFDLGNGASGGQTDYNGNGPPYEAPPGQSWYLDYTKSFLGGVWVLTPKQSGSPAGTDPSQVPSAAPQPGYEWVFGPSGWYQSRVPSGGGGGSSSPTNVFINNNPGDLNQDIVSDGSDGFPAGTVYQRNQLTGAITIKYRPPVASNPADKDNNGLDDSTNLAIGVYPDKNSSTGYAVYGASGPIPVFGNGGDATKYGATYGGATDPAEPHVTSVGGVPYIWDAKSGQFIPAPGIQGPQVSQGGGVGSSGGTSALLNSAATNSAALINAQAAAARAQNDMAAQRAQYAFQAQQAANQQKFQADQAALNRAMQQQQLDENRREFEATYGLQQRSQQADIATQYANAAGSVDPLYFESWLAGGLPLNETGNNSFAPIFSRIGEGTNAISPRSLEAAGELYGLLQGGQTSLPSPSTSGAGSSPAQPPTTSTGSSSAGSSATSGTTTRRTRTPTPLFMRQPTARTTATAQTPEEALAAAQAAQAAAERQQAQAQAEAKRVGSYGNAITQRQMGLNLATQGTGITPDQWQGIYGYLSNPTALPAGYGMGSDGDVMGNGDLDAYLVGENGPELQIIDWQKGSYSVTPLNRRPARAAS